MYSQLKYSIILCLLMAGNFVQLAFAAEQNVKMPIKPASSIVQKVKVVPAVDEAAMLRAQNNRMRKQVINLNQRITDFQNNKWFCAEPGEANFNVDRHLSVTKSGKVQDCSPYNCNYISGTCNTFANTSSDCSSGYNWIDGGRCITVLACGTNTYDAHGNCVPKK